MQIREEFPSLRSSHVAPWANGNRLTGQWDIALRDLRDAIISMPTATGEGKAAVEAGSSSTCVTLSSVRLFELIAYNCH